MNSIKAFLRGYTTEFDSPYTIETCAQMLRDQSAHDYFRQQSQSTGLNNMIFVDVNRVSDDEYTFYIRQQILSEKSAYTDLIGTLTRTGDKTHIRAKLEISMRFWLTQAGYMMFVIIAVLLVINFLVTLSLWSGDILFIVMLFGSFWFMPIRTLNQFLHLPQKWLSGIPEKTPSQMTPSRWNIFKRDFNAYAKADIPTCIMKLDSNKDDVVYQYTPLGMLKGKTTANRMFISFMRESDDKTYFWMQPDARTLPTGYPIELFGSLVTEDDGTRISGFCMTRRAENLVIGGSLVIVILSAIYLPVALVIGGLGIIVAVPTIMGLVGQWSWYPIREIIGESAIPRGRTGFIRLRHQFNFISPYPIEDCANMFMEYSAPNDILITPSGETTGNVVDEGLFIAVYPTKPDEYHFWIQSQHNKRNPQVQVIGSMQTEGYGTRIIGYSHSPTGWIWILGVSSMAFIMTLLTSFLFSPLMLMGILSYAFILNKVDSVGSYPQRVLGLTAQRKRKLADMDTKEE